MFHRETHNPFNPRLEPERFNFEPAVPPRHYGRKHSDLRTTKSEYVLVADPDADRTMQQLHTRTLLGERYEKFLGPFAEERCHREQRKFLSAAHAFPDGAALAKTHHLNSQSAPSRELMRPLDLSRLPRTPDQIMENFPKRNEPWGAGVVGGLQPAPRFPPAVLAPDHAPADDSAAACRAARRGSAMMLDLGAGSPVDASLSMIQQYANHVAPGPNSPGRRRSLSRADSAAQLQPVRQPSARDLIVLHGHKTSDITWQPNAFERPPLSPQLEGRARSRSRLSFGSDTDGGGGSPPGLTRSRSQFSFDGDALASRPWGEEAALGASAPPQLLADAGARAQAARGPARPQPPSPPAPPAALLAAPAEARLPRDVDAEYRARASNFRNLRLVDDARAAAASHQRLVETRALRAAAAAGVGSAAVPPPSSQAASSSSAAASSSPAAAASSSSAGDWTAAASHRRRGAARGKQRLLAPSASEPTLGFGIGLGGGVTRQLGLLEPKPVATVPDRAGWGAGCGNRKHEQKNYHDFELCLRPL